MESLPSSPLLPVTAPATPAPAPFPASLRQAIEEAGVRWSGAGVDLNEWSEEGRTLLGLLAIPRRNDSNGLLAMALHAGADVHAKDRHGLTAIQHVAMRGTNVEAGRILLDAGADPNSSNGPEEGTTAGSTVLMMAMLAMGMDPQQSGMTRLLLDAGADPNKAHGDPYSAHEGETPLYRLIDVFESICSWTPPSPEGIREIESMLVFLLDKGANPNLVQTMEGKTAAHHLSDVTAFLLPVFLDYGLDLYRSDANGKTALEQAVFDEREVLAQALRVCMSEQDRTTLQQDLPAAVGEPGRPFRL
jgi:ankyrin repeat protein